MSQPFGEDLADLALATSTVASKLVVVHQAERGSDVEAWLKAEREKYTKRSEAWYALDDLLDNYRERADTGRGMGV